MPFSEKLNHLLCLFSMGEIRIMKCKKEKEKQYNRITIRSLLNSLEDIMARNPNITLDSEVIISDINMGVFKNEIKVHPTFDYKDNKVKVGIYTNPYEKDELLDTVEETEQVTEQVSEQVNTKEVQAIKQMVEEPIQPTQEIMQPVVEETTEELAWLNKYVRN